MQSRKNRRRIYAASLTFLATSIVATTLLNASFLRAQSHLLSALHEAVSSDEKHDHSATRIVASEPLRANSIHAGIGSEPQLRPVAFLQETPAEESAKPELKLTFADDKPIPTTRPVNAKEFSQKFNLKLTGFPPTAEGGTIQVFGRAVVDGVADDSGGIEIPLSEPSLAANEIVNSLEREIALKQIMDQGARELVAIWTPNQGDPVTTEKNVTLTIDTIGPSLRSVELTGQPDQGPKLLMEFDSDDFDPSTVNARNFVVERIFNDGRFGPSEDATPTIAKIREGTPAEKSVIQLQLGKLANGVYRARVIGTKSNPDASDEPFRDLAGNFAGETLSEKKGRNQERVFGANPAPEPAQRIEYPEFQSTLPQPNSPRRINAGDKVETAVVRLYYMRDAHQVAQVVNRTVKSLNRAAVTLAERRAEESRDQADQLTDDRRSYEREAVQAAEDLRRAAKQLEGARATAATANELAVQLSKRQSDVETRINGLNDEVSQLTTEKAGVDAAVTRLQEARSNGVETTPAPSSTEDNTAGFSPQRYRKPQRLPSIARVTHLVSRLQQPAEETSTDDDLPTLLAKQARLAQGIATKEAQLASLEDEKKSIDGRIAQLDAQNKNNAVKELQQKVESLRNTATAKNEKALETQAREDRAREKQFRLEVAAAHADPNTYAPGKIDSVDPVAQVSISVIGEGLIQLRGPRKGIDKIRTMIHEMDAPVGQVKAEIVTVQVNGEKGERMERPIGEIEAHLNLGRYLTSQSLMMLRKAIQDNATQIALNNEGGHYQVDRDRRYLYSFFGRDFIDELYEMDSEFLYSENKLLSLNSMDTISLHQALFVLALAKNNVRQQILDDFMRMVRTDLVQSEFDFRRSAEIFPHKTRWHLPHLNRHRIEAHTLERVKLNNGQRYHFRNLKTFFGSLQCSGNIAGTGDMLNPVQREFIQLAQIFKSRLVGEMELKQRIIERTMIEDDREFNLAQEEEARNSLRPRVLQLSRDIQEKRLRASSALAVGLAEFRAAVTDAMARAQSASDATDLAIDLMQPIITTDDPRILAREIDITRLQEHVNQIRVRFSQLKPFIPRLPAVEINDGQEMSISALLSRSESKIADADKYLPSLADAAKRGKMKDVYGWLMMSASPLYTALEDHRALIRATSAYWQALGECHEDVVIGANIARFDYSRFLKGHKCLTTLLNSGPVQYEHLNERLRQLFTEATELNVVNVEYKVAKHFLFKTRQSLNQRKLLDFAIEEQEEKVIDMLEGTRAHIAAVDNYLKRLAIALEDDFRFQFYDPAFVRIRHAAREWDVTLGQVERTSVLTNNRAFAKVTPQATMEFDLPKRKIAIAEIMDNTKALVQDYGALLQDPTFLAAAQLQGLRVPNGQVQNVLPGLPGSGDEQQLGISPNSNASMPSGSALQSLVPDPSVYKFETGTGYEIRPVIQPDGTSIVYDFDYMYTTNVREPVQADEKHLGRVRRHFINTQVQTSSFELREISRYQVALKAARTSQGVQGLQDIPVAGLLFRPLPSAESSIQQNIILGSAVVYPTLFDLMGLRWAPSIVDLNHISVRDSEHVVRGRHRTVTDTVFDISSKSVDEILGIKQDYPEHFRPDLYHRQRRTSPYHPGGYTDPDITPQQDPTGRGFEIHDRRPVDMRQPPYDRRFRTPIRFEHIEETYEAREDEDNITPTEPIAPLTSESRIRIESDYIQTQPVGVELIAPANGQQTSHNSAADSSITKQNATVAERSYRMLKSSLFR